ncbi:RAD50-interacting protein 1 isoform X2 [Manduca sexta]|uniref:RAD50-interacting protein 1 isoform X2 n=1 Tax=Manduca sexta TaxID=7130 RepID=UPI0011841A3C|nr:RAD50-interacting protein 1 isoform X2 [Manduca sexta]
MMYVINELKKKGNVDEKEKAEIIQDVNNRVGGDINDLVNAYNLENELSLRKKHLVSCLNLANNEVPSKIFSAIRKAISNTNEVENLKARREALDARVETFYNETESLRTELNKRFTAINKLEQALEYMKSYEKIDALSRQMKQCSDDELMVLLYGDLKEMSKVYNKGHRATYIKEYLHYWHNVLKDKITNHYEDVLKQIKWPFVTGSENATPPKEALVKFKNLTRYLFLIQEPEDQTAKPVSEEVTPESNPCLPVKILLRPLKKRFLFHFTGTRQTARIDRPEWFLTQTLTWIKDHQAFVSAHVQPIAEKLDLNNVRAVDEFNAGLIALAAERLYTVLALYHTQVAKGEIVDVDAAFAHAVDETLGFNRELTILIGREENSVLSVLTKAETFVRWLSVEKKYALAKMDETLGNDQWGEPVAAGVGAASGAVLWVPRAADWFVSLLKTIEDRYAALPQPGHRLQFLELQLELIEEWRVRLMQLMNAAVETLTPESFLAARGAQALPAVVNAAHYTRSVLLQRAHSLHYLQLHYYRRQFLHFTHQHHEEDSTSSSSSDDEDSEEQEEIKPKPEGQMEDAMSLNEVEQRAKKMAINAISRRNSHITDPSQIDISSPIANLAVTEPLGVDEDIEVAGVFAEAPALLARVRDAGLAILSEHILLEFKAGLRDYKRQKWHGLVVVEARALSVSAALCGPLGALCMRMRGAGAALAPPLAAALRAHLAAELDHHIYQEVVLESWFNTGGTMQFTHDVKRNLVPAFAPPNKVASQVNQLPKLLEACKLLNLDYDDARRLRTMLAKSAPPGIDGLSCQGIRHITPSEALQILNQRTDLSDATSPTSVMELF